MGEEEWCGVTQLYLCFFMILTLLLMIVIELTSFVAESVELITEYLLLETFASTNAIPPLCGLLIYVGSQFILFFVKKL